MILFQSIGKILKIWIVMVTLFDGMHHVQASARTKSVMRDLKSAKVLPEGKVRLDPVQIAQRFKPASEQGAAAQRANPAGGKMTESFDNYVQALEQKYNKLAGYAPELFTTYITAFFDTPQKAGGLWSLFSGPKTEWTAQELAAQQQGDWVNPSEGGASLTNLYKGLELLNKSDLVQINSNQKIQIKDKDFTPYITELQKTFPYVSQSILKLYIQECFKESVGIQKPEDVAKSPEWPGKNSEGNFVSNPTRLQKLYATLLAIQDINHAHKDAIKSDSLQLGEQVAVQEQRNFVAPEDGLNLGVGAEINAVPGQAHDASRGVVPEQPGVVAGDYQRQGQPGQERVQERVQEQQPFLVQVAQEPVPQKYEHKPITIPEVDATEGKAQNILDALNLQAPKDNISFLQLKEYQPSISERLLGLSSPDVLNSKQNKINIDALKDFYLGKNEKDAEKAFIALQKDIIDLNKAEIKAKGNLEKNYQAVLAIAHNASATLNKQVRDKKVQDILSNLADVQDVSVSQMLKDYTHDSVKLTSDHFDNNSIKKILQEQSNLICQQVKDELGYLAELTTFMEQKISSDQLTDEYLKSDSFKDMRDQKLRERKNLKFNDFLTKSLSHQLELKIKKIEVLEEQAKEVESLAESLWSDYREKKQIKDEITSLQQELSDNKVNLNDTQKEVIEKFSPDSFTSLKTKQEIIAKIREFKIDLNLDVNRHQNIVNLIEKTISTIEKLSDDVIKQAFADLKNKLLDVACKDKNYSQAEMQAVEAYKNGQKLNETAAPQDIKNLFKKFDDAQKDYQKKTSKKGDKERILQEALKTGFHEKNYESIINEHIQAIKILNIKNENDKKIRHNAAEVGKTLFYSQKLNVSSVAWLKDRIESLKKDSQSFFIDPAEELVEFGKKYGEQKYDLFNGIETNQDLIVFYQTILEQYENESWIGGFLRRINTALDSMANKSSGRAVRDVSIAVGTGFVYVPMASVEAFNILSVSVDEYFASTFKIDINGPKYKAFKLAISVKILIPAAAALTAINASNMTIDQKTKAKHDVLSAVFADTVNYAAASSLGVSTDVLKSGDGQYIAETALLNQMMNSLNDSTGNDYALDGHAASNTENLDAAMSKYRSYLSQDATTSYVSGAYGA